MEISPRETMANLPRFLQPFLTWLTGMPLARQTPLFQWTALRLGVVTMGQIILGLLIGLLALNIHFIPGLPLLIASWLLVAGGIRMFFAVIEHQCTHYKYNQSPNRDVKRRANKLIAEVIAVLFWVESYKDFRDGHTIHHRSTRLPDDPENILLYQCGLRAGMSGQQLSWQLVKTILSPMFYVRVLMDNTRSNFEGSTLRKLVTAGYLCTLAFAVIYFDVVWYFAILWLVPVLIFSPISMVINTLTEHRWPELNPDSSSKEAGVYVGRFCGDPVPANQDASFPSWLLQWTIWWTRLFFLHLPYRLFILVGDLPQHDLHHRFPATDWMNATYLRPEFVRSGRLNGNTDVWGSMMDHIRHAANPPKRVGVT